MGESMGCYSSSWKKASLQLTWVFVVSKDRKWHPRISRAKRFQTLTYASYTLSYCSHWLTKLSLWTKSPKCLSEVNFISLETASERNLLHLLWTPFLLMLSARSSLKNLYCVQFPISKSSMGWKIGKRVSESVSGMLSQKPVCSALCWSQK